MNRSRSSVRKWEKKWDTSGPYAKFAWFPSTLVQTRKFVPLGEIDASVQATMSGALLMRTRSALSQAERRAVELSLAEESKLKKQQEAIAATHALVSQKNVSSLVDTTTRESKHDDDGDDADDVEHRAKRARQ
jgi:hypothetical protein